MLPAEVLAIWSECCEASGADWYLYADTLLCAKGYGAFPNTLNNAQVAVFAADLTCFVEQVFPKLPADWSLDMHQFAVKQSSICFKKEDAIVLELHVLYPLEDPEEAEAFSAEMRKLRANTRAKHWPLRIINKLSCRILGKWIAKKRSQLDKKAFYRLLSLAQGGTQAPLFYCDHLTSKGGVILSQELLAKTEQLACDGIPYPVFSGYGTYLTDVYGDYEAGLFDEIGCGLTVQGKEELKAHQARCKEALAFIQELSEEFGLRYYLLAGSVLGCVRHGGFIPWDDDIDLGIRIEDLARFEEVVKEHLPNRLPEGFQLIQSGPNNGYPRMFSKICYEGRCCMDLWPLVPTYTDGLKAKFTWYFAKIITKVHYKKLNHKITRFVKLVNLMSLFMTDKMVLWFARQNERKYQNRKTPAYINLYSIYRRNKETIQRVWLDTEATGNFEGITVPIVGCTEAYLTHMYGDYMAFPPPWKRASHHIDRFSSTQTK